MALPLYFCLLNIFFVLGLILLWYRHSLYFDWHLNGLWCMLIQVDRVRLLRSDAIGLRTFAAHAYCIEIEYNQIL